jgi:hypothetical protein
MCSHFLEAVSFHQTKAMASINVIRSLTIHSIINFFLKVNVLMHLITTSGSFRLGNPSRPPHCGLLILKKNHHFKNTKVMVTATPQVAQPSLVISLPTTDTS